MRAAPATDIFHRAGLGEGWCFVTPCLGNLIGKLDSATLTCYFTLFKQSVEKWWNVLTSRCSLAVTLQTSGTTIKNLRFHR